MKIIGTGVDIVENSRIKKSIANNSFLNRIQTPPDFSFCLRLHLDLNPLSLTDCRVSCRQTMSCLLRMLVKMGSSNLFPAIFFDDCMFQDKNFKDCFTTERWGKQTFFFLDRFVSMYMLILL